MWVHEQGAWPSVAAIALVSVGAIGIAPTVQTPPRPTVPAVPAVRLAAATSPTVVQPLAQQSNVLGALLSLDLRIGRLNAQVATYQASLKRLRPA